jgi:hypothetical protein
MVLIRVILATVIDMLDVSLTSVALKNIYHCTTYRDIRYYFFNAKVSGRALKYRITRIVLRCKVFAITPGCTHLALSSALRPIALGCQSLHC